MTRRKLDPNTCVHAPEVLISDDRPIRVKVECWKCGKETGEFPTMKDAWEAWHELTGLPEGKNTRESGD